MRELVFMDVLALVGLPSNRGEAASVEQDRRRAGSEVCASRHIAPTFVDPDLLHCAAKTTTSPKRDSEAQAIVVGSARGGTRELCRAARSTQPAF